MQNYEVLQKGATLSDIENRVKQLITDSVYSFAQKFNENTEASTQAGRHLIFTSIIDMLQMKRSIKDSACDKLEHAMETNEFKPEIEKVTFYVKVLPLPTDAMTQICDNNKDVDRAKGPLYVYFACLPDQWTAQDLGCFPAYDANDESGADHITFFEYERDDDSDDDSLPELETPSTDGDIPDVPVNVNL